MSSVQVQEASTQSVGSRLNAEVVARYAAASTLLVVLVVAAIATPSFYSGGNLRTVALQASSLGVIVLGQTLALLVRGLDMSVSAVVAFTGALMVHAIGAGKTIWFLVIALVLAVLVGLANGLLVTWRRVPPFVATFAMLIVVGGIQLAYTHGQTSGSAPGWLSSLGTRSVVGVPVPVIIWLVLAVALWFGLVRTRGGRWIYATGTNPEAARHAGVPVTAVIITAYVLCAILAMVAGVILSGYLGYVDQTLGVNSNLDSLTAAIIGGVAFSGGRGGVWGATVGAILLTVLVNLVVVAGLAQYWQYIVSGVVLVIAVSLQSLRGRHRSSG